MDWDNRLERSDQQNRKKNQCQKTACEKTTSESDFFQTPFSHSTLQSE